MSNTIWRWIKISALAAAIAMPIGSVAWGQDGGRYDNGNYYSRDHDVREQGYRRGHDDGFRRGQSDAERGRRFKFKTDDWEDSRGYEHWMGDKRDYKFAYRDGYERGYRDAYNNYGYRYRDRDAYR